MGKPGSATDVVQCYITVQRSRATRTSYRRKDAILTNFSSIFSKQIHVVANLHQSRSMVAWWIALARGGSRIPRRRGRQPYRGAPTYDFAKFCEKLHEIEKILGRRGAGAGHAPLNPPLLTIGEILRYSTQSSQKTASVTGLKFPLMISITLEVVVWISTKMSLPKVSKYWVFPDFNFKYEIFLCRNLTIHQCGAQEWPRFITELFCSKLRSLYRSMKQCTNLSHKVCTCCCLIFSEYASVPIIRLHDQLELTFDCLFFTQIFKQFKVKIQEVCEELFAAVKKTFESGWIPKAHVNTWYTT